MVRRYINELIMVVIYALAVITYYTIFTRYELVYGIDGPYYIVQVKYLITHGRQYYPDPPLTFYVMALLYMVVKDFTWAVKLVPILLIPLGVFPIYLLILRETHSKLLAVSASAIYVFNPYTIRLSGDLIKNALGLTLFLYTLYFTYLSIKERKWVYAAVATTLSVAVGLTHILALGTQLAFTTLVLTYLALSDRSRLKYVVPILIINIALVVVGTYTPLLGWDVFKGLRYVEELSGLESTEPIRKPQPPAVLKALAIERVLGISLIASSVIIAFKRRNTRLLLIPLIALLIFANNPLNPPEFEWRFLLLNSILLPIPIVYLINEVRGCLVRVALLIPIVMVLISQAVPIALIHLRPTITPLELNELREINQKFPNETVYVVPNVALKYWVETIMNPENVVKSPKELSEVPNKGPYILLISNEDLRHRPPPMFRVAYRGTYFTAYLMPPRP
ncbi:MAG: hypothetical protein DRO18_03550 [Thermoprotei archaeon]|nr:MAG: hypothetical protein DRO18_03550 [Thermoprotei archaeon]